MSLPAPLGQLVAGPVFVVGHVRSGTSYVYDLLVAHPQVAGVFESWMFSDELGFKPLFHWAHWQPEWSERTVELTGQPAGLRALVTREEVVAEVRDVASRWLARALAPHHAYLVEKSPPHLHAVPLIAEVFPDARFVHVLRDGRDVVVSVNAAAASWNPAWKRPRRRMVAEWGHAWSQGVEAMRAAADAIREQMLEVRFEQLRASPGSEVRRLFHFCGVPCDDSQMAAVLDATDLGRQARGEDKFRRRGGAGEWRRHWNLVDALRFERVAGETLRATGYERDPRWWWRCGVRRRRQSGAT